MAELQAGSHPRKSIIRKTNDILEKETQLKFLKELFPVVSPMVLHDALCEVNFDADEAVKILISSSENVTQMLSFAQWKTETSGIISSVTKREQKSLLKSVINKRPSTLIDVDDSKRVKLEKLFKEKKGTKSTPDTKEPTLQQKSRIVHVAHSFSSKQHIEEVDEKTNNLKSKIIDVEDSDSTGMDTELYRKSEDKLKHLRSSGPVEVKIMDFIIKKRSRKSSENVLKLPMNSSHQEQTVARCSNYNSYDGNDLENDRNVLLHIFQTASFNDLNVLTSFSKRAVDAIVECRPYENWMDLIQKLQANKFLDIDVLNTARQFLDIHKNLKILISKLENISKTKGEIDFEKISHQPSLVSPFVRLTEQQMLGFNWLVSMRDKEFNGILVDEDQFSTSVQIISFLAYLKEIKATKDGVPHLVIVPAWKKDDWRSDFRRISPSLKVFFYHGKKDERRRYRNEWYKGDIAKYDVILAVEGTFTSTPEENKMYRIMQWHCVVFDETFGIKNASNVYYENLMKIKASQKILLLTTVPQTNVLEVLSVLKFIFPTDFDTSSEDLATFINKNLKNTADDLSSFHLEIMEQAAKVVKASVFQRLKKETPVSGNVPSCSSSVKSESSEKYFIPRNINDEIESIIREIQRFDLPIKLAFSQLTTFPRVYVEKLDLAKEMMRIKGSIWKNQSSVAIRGGRGWRRSRGMGRGRWSHLSYRQRYDADSYSSTESSGCFSAQSSTKSYEMFNAPEDSKKVVRNVAIRGRKWAGAVRQDTAASLPNVARRGKKFMATPQVTRSENDVKIGTRRSWRGKRRGRGRSRRYQITRDLPKRTIDDETDQKSTSTKKIQKVKPTIVQTTRLENDRSSDSDFNGSNLSSSTNSDTDDQSTMMKNKKKDKKTTNTTVENSLALDCHLKNMIKDIWNENDNCGENVAVDVKIELEETVKREPIDNEIKIEPEEISYPKPSSTTQQSPPSPQEDPLHIREEDRVKVAESAPQFNVVNIFNQSIVLNSDDIAKNNNQDTNRNKSIKQSNDEPDRNSAVIDLTDDNNDCIVISDDSEVEEQLNKKISFNEVLADIDEQISTSFRTQEKKIKKESDKTTAVSKDSGIVESVKVKLLETKASNNTSTDCKTVEENREPENVQTEKTASENNSKTSKVVEENNELENVQSMKETTADTNDSITSNNITKQREVVEESSELKNVKFLKTVNEKTNAKDTAIIDISNESDNVSKDSRIVEETSESEKAQFLKESSTGVEVSVIPIDILKDCEMIEENNEPETTQRLKKDGKDSEIVDKSPESNNVQPSKEPDAHAHSSDVSNDGAQELESHDDCEKTYNDEDFSLAILSDESLNETSETLEETDTKLLSSLKPTETKNGYETEQTAIVEDSVPIEMGNPHIEVIEIIVESTNDKQDDAGLLPTEMEKDNGLLKDVVESRKLDADFSTNNTKSDDESQSPDTCNSEKTSSVNILSDVMIVSGIEGVNKVL